MVSSMIAVAGIIPSIFLRIVSCGLPCRTSMLELDLCSDLELRLQLKVRGTVVQLVRLVPATVVVLLSLQISTNEL